MQHMYSIFAFNSILCWITCRGNQFLVFVPEKQEKMNSLISPTIHCIHVVDFYIQISFTIISALSINILYLYSVFQYVWIDTHWAMKAKGDHHCSKKVEREEQTQTRRAGSEVERRCYMTCTFWTSSPDARWEANFVLAHNKALQHKQRKQQQDCASG